MNINKADTIKTSSYNILNLSIFIILYIWVFIYQFRFNSPASYFIAFGVDVIFCIYLLIFCKNTLSKSDSLISAFSILIVFGFIVIRLISSYTFPFAFTKMQQKRKEDNGGCSYDDLPTFLKDQIFKYKYTYLYSTVFILLFLFLVLFWFDKINANYNPNLVTVYEILGATSKKTYVFFVVKALLIAFSIMNTHYSTQYYLQVNRTTMCDKLDIEKLFSENSTNKYINNYEFKYLFEKSGGFGNNPDDYPENRKEKISRYIFNLYDRDGDELLDYDEYKVFYDEYFNNKQIELDSNDVLNEKIDEKHLNNLFNRYSENDIIELKNFRALCKETKLAKNKSKATKLYSEFNGPITRNKLYELFDRYVYNKTDINKSVIDDILNKMKIDEGNIITQNELAIQQEKQDLEENIEELKENIAYSSYIKEKNEKDKNLIKNNNRKCGNNKDDNGLCPTKSAVKDRDELKKLIIDEKKWLNDNKDNVSSNDIKDRNDAYTKNIHSIISKYGDPNPIPTIKDYNEDKVNYWRWK